MAAPQKRGASFERLCADLFGGVRVGNRGKSDADVVTPTLAIETKRVEEASIRGSWIAQGRAAGAKYGLPWLVVHARKGSPRSTTTMETEFAIELLTAAGYIAGKDAE